MLDANSVVESGTQHGNLQFFGSFDQCLGLRVPDSIPRRLSTHSMQYCTVKFPISDILGPDDLKPLEAPYLERNIPRAAICFPAACSAKSDLKVILDKCKNLFGNLKESRIYLLKKLLVNFSTSYQILKCATKPCRLTTAQCPKTCGHLTGSSGTILSSCKSFWIILEYWNFFEKGKIPVTSFKDDPR